jgi:uncharacterized delta-60 repeat protein
MSGDVALALSVQTDGRIVVAGYSHDGENLALARYNADGSLDTSFDREGIVSFSSGPGNEDLRSVAIQQDGRVVAAGVGPDGNFVVVRINGVNPTVPNEPADEYVPSRTPTREQR